MSETTKVETIELITDDDLAEENLNSAQEEKDVLNTVTLLLFSTKVLLECQSKLFKIMAVLAACTVGPLMIIISGYGIENLLNCQETKIILRYVFMGGYITTLGIGTTCLLFMNKEYSRCIKNVRTLLDQALECVAEDLDNQSEELASKPTENAEHTPNSKDTYVVKPNIAKETAKVNAVAGGDNLENEM